MKAFNIVLFMSLVLMGCHDDSKNCIDPLKKKPAACYEIYKPVCGCDGKTYSNDCFASAAGVISWTDGTCGE